jgi:hypothetical protein
MEILQPIKNLYSDAEANGAIDYIYTLLRATGPEVDRRDSLLMLRSDLETRGESLSDEDIFSAYCSLADQAEPLFLIANLLNCAQNRPYSIVPFHHLKQGQWPNEKKPTLSEIARELSKMAVEAGRSDLASLIDEAYPKEVMDGCSSQVPPPIEKVWEAFHRCRVLLSSLVTVYFEERLSYRNPTIPRLYKTPLQFWVFELLVNNDDGLYGFRMHFSNGSSAWFERHSHTHDGLNFMLVPNVQFFVGSLDQIPNGWRVGTQRLHEIGLPGRYNEMGEWKPILYPGSPDDLFEEVSALSPDANVRGTLFYIIATGHRAIEFVVRTPVDLPYQSGTVNGEIHLWKCPPLDDVPHTDHNVRVYDGWLSLKDIDPESIKYAIAKISVVVNRLAFAYGVSLDWHLKYRSGLKPKLLRVPSVEDMDMFNALLTKFPNADDAFILRSAVDWHTRGNSSQNVFSAFLCYYVAIENVAVAVADGKADFGLAYQKESKSKRREQRLNCIQEAYDRLYLNNPEQFVQEAYFNCIHGIKEKTRRIVKMVFGPDHEYLQLLFEKDKDGYSLSEIRNKLAHGDLTPSNQDDEALIHSHLENMELISKEFLTRLIFMLKPTDDLPAWSGAYMTTIHANHPGHLLCVSHEDMLPTTDWRIRPEWVS